MNTNPSSCCLCINLRLATFLLAVAQTLGYGIQAYQLYTAPEFNDLLSSIALFSCTFLSFIGLYGVFGVFKKNALYIRLFSRYFLYELVFSVVSVFFISFSFLDSRNALCMAIIDQEGSLEDNVCLSSEYPKVLLSFLGLFVLGAMLRLHYFFSIRSFARQIEQEEQQSNSPVITKVVYPQYVFVASDDKASLA